MTGSLRAWQALLLPLICALLWAFPVRSAHATVTCTVRMPNVAFGQVNLVRGINLTTSATLTYTCTNNDTRAQYVNICFNAENGAQGGGNFNPRVMKYRANTLQFQLYTPTSNTIWGNATSPPQYSVQLRIPGKSGGSNGTTGQL
ncbi:MAG: Csu type fimbrial protein, partial [Rhodoferax sp.]